MISFIEAQAVYVCHQTCGKVSKRKKFTTYLHMGKYKCLRK